MAYDQKVIFEVKTSLNSNIKVEYPFFDCEWGWVVKESELSEMMIDGELEYKAILLPEEMVKRYEANIIKEREKKNTIKFEVVPPLRKDPLRGMRFITNFEPINRGRLGHSKTFLKDVQKPKTYYW